MLVLLTTGRYQDPWPRELALPVTMQRYSEYSDLVVVLILWLPARGQVYALRTTSSRRKVCRQHSNAFTLTFKHS